MASINHDDDDDEDLRKAIALSLQGVQGSIAEKAITLDEVFPKNPTSAPNPSNGLGGLLGLNRKQMEQERLSRKRKASSSPPPASKSIKAPFSSSAKSSKLDRDPTFLKGVVKRTWVRGDHQCSDSIKLEEVLEKDDLQLAVLSSFQWDIPWLFAKMSVTDTFITLIMQAKDEPTKEQYRQETAHMPKLRLCFPSMERQINCMHSKLMLLSHKNYLRIVVPTANLVSYDWGETGTMENMCFIIDLPRLSDGQQVDDMTPFGEELVYFLNAQGLEKSIVSSLYKFDFSNTKDIAFIHTIGGPHIGSEEPWRRTGFCGLGRAVKRLGLQTDKDIDVDFVASSVGSLNLDFLASIYLACQGDSGDIMYESKDRGKETQPSRATYYRAKSLVERHFRVYFPSYDTVRSSMAGSAGTICFQSKWYNSPTFPKLLMRDCQSKRQGILMHNKAIYVSNSSRPWAYIGSANCSESAWGSPSKDRSSKIPKLNCRNWECGVLIPAKRNDETKTHEERKEVLAERVESSTVEHDFDGLVPVPMVVPGPGYGSKKPWYYAES